ncbi:hypothetical protein TSUD_420800, partial [Trifolium subterraneum]
VESQCPNLHLSHFYDACDYTDPPGISESDKRLRLFKFSLTGRAKDWLDTIPPGTITTWKDLERKFKDRYFPIHKFLERRSEIMNFEQDELQQMQYFTQGLRPQTRMLLDASAGGSLKNKDEVEAKELVETMAQNEYRAQNDRGAKKKVGILEFDTNNAILAQMKLMSKEMEELKKASSRGSQAHVNQFEEVKCDFCRGGHENGQNSNSNPPARKPSPMEESINKFIQVTQESIDNPRNEQCKTITLRNREIPSPQVGESHKKKEKKKVQEDEVEKEELSEKKNEGEVEKSKESE